MAVPGWDIWIHACITMFGVEKNGSGLMMTGMKRFMEMKYEMIGYYLRYDRKKHYGKELFG